MEKNGYFEENKIFPKKNNNNIFLGNNIIKEKNEEEELRKITEKLKEERKINNILKSENEKLYQDIITIKSNIKSLIPSIAHNKIFPFPTIEQLIEEIKTYISIDSVKYFQRLQNRQFPLDIIILHFKCILQKTQELLDTHFSNVDFILSKKFKSPELTRPIQSVLKNAYQVDWKNIFNKLSSDDKINIIIQEIKENITFKLNKKKYNNISNFGSPTYINHLKEYIIISLNILLKCFLNTPKIFIDITKIGRVEKFNSTSNECFLNDKILRGSEVVIVFPSFFYSMDKIKKKEIINKDKVVVNKFNEKNGSINNKNNYGTNNSGYSYKNKNSFKNNYFTKKYEEEQDNNSNYYNRNKINEIYTGYKNNNYSWSNNNKNLNCHINTNQNIKKIYFHQKGEKDEEHNDNDSEKEDYKFYK
jgi:hypothetical protein